MMIARPVMWALSAGGEKELISLFKKLEDELRLIMQLAGCKSLEVIYERGLTLLTGPGMIYQKLSLLNNPAHTSSEFSHSTSLSKSSMFNKCRL